jgi:hypothetical protein
MLEDRINDSIADGAIAHDLMIAQYPILFRAQAFNCSPRNLVEKMCPELYRYRFLFLKDVLE